MNHRASFAWIVSAAAPLVFALAFPAGTVASRSADVRSLTLGEAVTAALRANIELRQAEAVLDARRLSLRRSKSDFLPSVGLSVRSSDSWTKEYDPLLDRYDGATARSVSFGLSGSLELFTGFSRKNAVDQARLGLEAEEQSYARTRQSVLYDAVSRFLQAVLDKEILAVNEANLASQRRSLEHIDAYVAVGKRPVADLYQQQAAVADAEANLLEAQRNLDVSTLLLLETMGTDPTAGCSVVEPDAETIMASLDSLVQGITIDRALGVRRDIVAQRRAKEAAEKQISISRGGYWPSLSLSASLGTSYRDPAFVPGDFSDQLDRNMNASVGLSASLSIFDRFQTRNSVSQAKIDLRRSEINLENLELRVRVETGQALAGYETARKTIDVARAQLAYAEQALTNYEERYRLGASTLLELLQARAVYVQSSYSVARSRYDLILKGVALLYAADEIERALPLLN